MKDFFIEEYEKILAEAEEAGLPVDKNKASDLAYDRTIERFFSMCDEAKDRAKYK